MPSGQNSKKLERECDAADALLALKSTKTLGEQSGRSKKNRGQKPRVQNMHQKQKRPGKTKLTHICLGGVRAQGARCDCWQCSPHNFCMRHSTREDTYPRKRECAVCHPELKIKQARKNLCQHHLDGCENPDCLGCKRKDRCEECSGFFSSSRKRKREEGTVQDSSERNSTEAGKRKRDEDTVQDSSEKNPIKVLELAAFKLQSSAAPKKECPGAPPPSPRSD